ncbi:MAG: flagellar synthesis regulator FleN [Syntrophobacteraceae bacterium CG07_land_8_20_14_0_80_61_8]|nr:MAG: flagellar synthesis regulator FleN [Syntrophobacteraceae bacterium CG07_land_8_20_14_0_80_61_8]
MRNNMDQALGLRNKESASMDPLASRPLAYPGTVPVRVIAVSSGKGGVGKSSVVVNLAVALDRVGKRVLIMDADLGLANIDVLLGLTPKYNIGHVLDGSRDIGQVLVNGPGRIKVLSATSGVQELTRLSDEQKLLLLDVMDDLQSEVDVVLIDNGAGISDSVLYFSLAAQEKIVVVTPEPTSLTDAYAFIKVLHLRHGERHFKILINSVKDERAGRAVFAKISRVAEHFLDGLALSYLGAIPFDYSLHKAVMQQRSLLEAFPSAAASKAFTVLAEVLEKEQPQTNFGNINFFWKRLLQI